MTDNPMDDFLSAMAYSDAGGPPVDDLDGLMASIESETSQAPFERPDQAGDAESPGVFIVIVVEGAQYAIPIGCALEMDVAPPITPVPFVPDWILGVTNRRGEILAVVDLRKLLRLDPAGAQNGRIVVASTGDAGLTAALLVDEVRGTVSMPRARFAQPAGSIADTAAAMLAGVADHEGRLLGLLDIRKLLSAAAAGRTDGSKKRIAGRT